MRKMRALKNRKKNIDVGCVICKKKTCLDDVPKVIFKIAPNTDRVTRSVTRLIKSMSDFIIIEVYRCMPLLGNEEQLVPPWDVHIVHYAIVFKNITRVQYDYN